MVRRVVVAVIVFAVLAAIGRGGYAIARSSPAQHHPLAAGAERVRVPTTAPPVPPSEPGGGQTLFPSHRLVAFYGAPGSPKLGVLGDAPPEALWSRLAATAAPFASAGSVVVPGYELIAFGAQSAPGAQGSYAAELPASQIDSYLQVVHAHGGMLILDIQPGRGSLLADAQALERWLVQPDVALALDPEWELTAGQRPDQQIGHTTAAEINGVSAWLEQLTVSHHLPQKLLVVHQFTAAMVADKPAVGSQPDLAIVFNMDGFGGTANKLSVYQALAADTRWTLGYKLFYDRDRPLQTPTQVLALVPPPQLVEYE